MFLVPPLQKRTFVINPNQTNTITSQSLHHRQWLKSTKKLHLLGDLSSSPSFSDLQNKTTLLITTFYMIAHQRTNLHSKK